jgi:hypothetical protein
MNRILWALFGNDEDSVIGDASFNPERRDTWLIRLRWWLRNPAHNLCFHVINVPTPFTSAGLYPTDVFAPHGWNMVVHTGANGKQYPFISYIGRVKCYMGWRERGNFGIKFTLNRGR